MGTLRSCPGEGELQRCLEGTVQLQITISQGLHYEAALKRAVNVYGEQHGNRTADRHYFRLVKK